MHFRACGSRQIDATQSSLRAGKGVNHIPEARMGGSPALPPPTDVHVTISDKALKLRWAMQYFPLLITKAFVRTAHP